MTTNSHILTYPNTFLNMSYFSSATALARKLSGKIYKAAKSGSISAWQYAKKKSAPKLAAAKKYLKRKVSKTYKKAKKEYKKFLKRQLKSLDKKKSSKKKKKSVKSVKVMKRKASLAGGRKRKKVHKKTRLSKKRVSKKRVSKKRMSKKKKSRR